LRNCSIGCGPCQHEKLGRLSGRRAASGRMARWAFSARRLFGGRGCKADGHDSPTQVISTGTIRENGSVLSVFPFTGRHARRQKEARRAALLDGPHSIEVIHGLLTAMFNDTFRRVDGPAEALHQHLPLRLGGHADDPVDHVAPFARRAGADLDPGEV
ncbi:Winged helix-turn-helix transcriptional regulator, partial [Dysosmobacter welbionis]